MPLKHPPGPPMTLGNMRSLGVHHLIVYCLDDARRHTALIDVSAYSDDVEVPSFRRRVVCAKCGSRGNKIDVLEREAGNARSAWRAPAWEQ